MSRKAKPKESRPGRGDPAPKPAEKPSAPAAFNYSWRTAAAVPTLLLTLLIFLALPFFPERPEYPRWLVAAVGAGDLPASLIDAFERSGGLSAIGERFLIVVKALFALAISGGIGVSVLIGGFRRRELGEVETGALAFALGLASLSLVTFLASLAFGAERGCLYASLALVPLTAIALLVALRRRLREEPSIRTKSLPEAPVGLWLIVGLPATLFALLWGMLPPYEFDVLAYHFQVPKEWYAGGIGRTEGNVYGAMPHGAEMFVLWGMNFEFGEDAWFRGALVGKTILALFIPLTSLLAASIAGRIAGRAAGLFAGWTALTLPWLWSVGVTGLVDHVWALYFLAASWTAFRTWFYDRGDPEGPGAESVQEGDVPHADPPEGRSRTSVGDWTLRAAPSLRWAAVTGAFFGAAAACKYPAVPLIGGPLVVFHLACFVVASRRSGCDWSRFAKASAIATLAAALLGGGWYVKNIVLYGNPVFPLATGIFGDAGWPEELQANWARAHRVPGETVWEKWSPISLARSAWVWIFANEGASPLVALGLVALALAKRPPRATWILLALAGGFFVLFWMTTHRIPRFLVPTYPLLAVAVGVGFAAGASSIQRTMRQVAFWLGLAWCVAVTPHLRIETFVDARLLASIERLRVGDGFGLPPRIAPPVDWLNQNVKEGKVLSIGNGAVFDYRVPVVYHTCFDECPLQVWHDEANGEPSTLRRRLNEEGIAYVYVDWEWVERYRSPGNYGFPFAIVDRDAFAELIDEGVLRPSAVVGPSMEENGAPLWEIYPVAPDEANSVPSTGDEG